MLISLVIPIYNVEKYLVRCIQSLLDQNLPQTDYEIILVNDGTKDDSLKIANRFAAENEQIQVVSQENKGLSGARNTGLRLAKGKYVWFIDSDDSIASQCLKGLTDFMESYTLDMAHIGFTHRFNDGRESNYSPAIHSSGAPVSGETYFCDLDSVPTAWSYIHNRCHLQKNKLEFLEGIVHEDEEFLPRVMFFVQRVMTYPQSIYFYYENSSSIMSTRSLKSDLNKCIALKNFQFFLEDHSCSPAFRNKVRYRAFILFQTILHPSSFLKHQKEEQDLLISNLKSSFFYPITRIGPFQWKFFVYQILMNLDLKMYSRIRKLIG